MKKYVKEILETYVLNKSSEVLADYIIYGILIVFLILIVYQIFGGIKNKRNNTIKLKCIKDYSLTPKEFYDQFDINREVFGEKYWKHLYKTIRFITHYKEIESNSGKTLVLSPTMSGEEVSIVKECIKVSIKKIDFQADVSSIVYIEIKNISSDDQKLNMGISDAVIKSWFSLEINDRKLLSLFEVDDKNYLKNEYLKPDECLNLVLAFSSISDKNIRAIEKIRIEIVLKQKQNGPKIRFIFEELNQKLEEKYLEAFETKDFELTNNIVFLSKGGLYLISFIILASVSFILVKGLFGKIIIAITTFILIKLSCFINYFISYILNKQIKNDR